MEVGKHKAELENSGCYSDKKDYNGDEYITNTHPCRI
jgi:hypothetical protein